MSPQLCEASSEIAAMTQGNGERDMSGSATVVAKGTRVKNSKR